MNSSFLIILGSLIMTLFDLYFPIMLSYLDPGSGSLIIQLIVGGLIGFAVFFRGWFSIILGFFGFGSSKEEDEDADLDELDEDIE